MLVLVAALLGASCRGESPTTPVEDGHTTHGEGVVSVNGVRLHYLQWGATGDGLVFLHGLGDSPHAFDDLAPHFSDSFRVVSYARRGHGRSDVSGPYDNDTLVEDLRQLLDALRIERAVLVGWSLGGNEITEFAARWPDRVRALVHLDTFNLADPDLARANANFPFAFFPAPDDLASVEAFSEWQKRTWWLDTDWTPAMRPTAADLVVTNSDGSVRMVTSDSVTGELFAAAYRYPPRWSAVLAPTLALFAKPYPEAYLPPASPDEQRWKVEQWLKEHQMPLYEKRVREFRAASPHARVVELERTNHSSLPFQRHDRILSEMRTFLGVVISGSS